MLDKKKYKISIITPSLNSAEFIEEAILSVLKQSYNNFEHIIIDGGSSDATLDILKKYEHLKWISEPDKGQSDALNKGFKLAEGKIIGWLNADDIYVDGVFDSVNNFFLKNNTPDIIYGEIIFTDKNMQLKRRKYDHEYDRGILLYFDCIIPSAGTFFNRRIFEEGNYLDTSFKTSMDYDFFCMLASREYNFIYVPKPYAYFRKTGINYGKKYKSYWKNEVLKIKKKYTYLPFKNSFIFPFLVKVGSMPFFCKRQMLKIKAHGFTKIFNSYIEGRKFNKTLSAKI